MRYFGFEDDFGKIDKQQQDITQNLNTSTDIVTSLEDAVKRIGKLVYARYKFYILNRLVNEQSYCSIDKKDLYNILPGISDEAFQTILEHMGEAKMIRRDDGQTIYFTPRFVNSTSSKRYFEKM